MDVPAISRDLLTSARPVYTGLLVGKSVPSPREMYNTRIGIQYKIWLLFYGESSGLLDVSPRVPAAEAVLASSWCGN